MFSLQRSNSKSRKSNLTSQKQTRVRYLQVTSAKVCYWIMVLQTFLVVGSPKELVHRRTYEWKHCIFQTIRIEVASSNLIGPNGYSGHTLYTFLGLHVSRTFQRTLHVNDSSSLLCRWPCCCGVDVCGRRKTLVQYLCSCSSLNLFQFACSFSSLTSPPRELVDGMH